MYTLNLKTRHDLPYTPQSEKERGDLEVEIEHVRAAGGRQTLTSASKIRLSEMRLKREVTQLKQQILCVGVDCIELIIIIQ